MTALDDMWYLAVEARQRAEQAYHRLAADYDEFRERTRTDRVSRSRFRTLAERVKATGAPYGAHTIVHRDAEELLLVRHEGVGLWVPPGGEVDGTESFREAAERELAEEAGISADYEGLAMANRVEFECDGHEAWGILPVFAARAESAELTVDDPDGEISAARWFRFPDLPRDTRDRGDLIAWYERRSSR